METEEKFFSYPIAVGLSMEEVFSNCEGQPFTIIPLMKENNRKSEELCVSFDYDDVSVRYYFCGVGSHSICSSMEIVTENERKVCNIMNYLDEIFIPVEGVLVWHLLNDNILFTVTLDGIEKPVFSISSKPMPGPQISYYGSFSVGNPN